MAQSQRARRNGAARPRAEGISGVLRTARQLTKAHHLDGRGSTQESFDVTGSAFAGVRGRRVFEQ